VTMVSSSRVILAQRVPSVCSISNVAMGELGWGLDYRAMMEV
jgi:hypothetical protein